MDSGLRLAIFLPKASKEYKGRSSFPANVVLCDMRRAFLTVFLAGIWGCTSPKPQETPPPSSSNSPKNAESILSLVKDGLYFSCEVPEVPERMKELHIEDEAKALEVMEDIKGAALSCGGHELLEKSLLSNAAGGCSQRQSCNDACPIKWYWCIEHAGACAGGDDTSCCKLAMCGSTHHCHTVCQSSCNCSSVDPVGPSTASG